MLLLDNNLVNKIKSCIVGIGIVNSSNEPIAIMGTGVIIDPEGYFLTASHVIDDCLKRLKQIQTEIDKNAAAVIFNYIPFSTKNYNYTVAKINQVLPIKAPFGNSMINFDISLCNLMEKLDQHPYMEISNKRSFQVLDKISVCGYPGGEASLKPYDTSFMKIAMSPVLQLGMISSLIPADDAQTHHGLITDIYGTGGSSGSPIIDLTEGKIIGISQTVIGSKLIGLSNNIDTTYYFNKDTNSLTDVEIERKGSVVGYSQGGLITGVTSPVFSDVNKAISELKTGAKSVSNLQIHTAKQRLEKVS